MLDGVDAARQGPAAAGNWSEGEAVGPALASIVATAFGISVAEVWSDRRCAADVSFARQVAMYLAHTRLGLTQARTAGIFGRDRTTARHACRRVEERREDPRVDALLECLERALDVSSDLSRFSRREWIRG